MILTYNMPVRFHAPVTHLSWWCIVGTITFLQQLVDIAGVNI